MLVPETVRARTILAIETLLGSEGAQATLELMDDDSAAGSEEAPRGENAESR